MDGAVRKPAQTRLTLLAQYWVLYSYHALRHLSASRMGLIPHNDLVLALILAILLNTERFTTSAWIGFAAVISGLALLELEALRYW